MKGKRKLKGTVISDKMDKTVVVKIVRKVRHKRYEKLVEKWNKFYAHDESGKAKIGSEVTIVETRPLSKLKKFRVLEIH